MESYCLRHTELPNTTALFADYLYRFDRVRKFYDHAPFEEASYRQAAAGIEFPEERRSALVTALREQNPPSRSLDLLELRGTVAVVTGQQVGLFSGPAYTLYKALTAARLTQRLNEQGIPAVPVFWLASEDHDFAEVDHAWVFDERNHPMALRLPGRTGGDGPVGPERLRDIPIADLRRVLEPFPFGEPVVEMVEEAYREGETMASSFAGLMRRLLSGYGFLFVDPLEPAIRSLAAPLLRQALERAPELSAALLNRNRELEAAGYHAQVHLEPDTSLVFLLDGARRIALRRHEDGYSARDRRFGTGELQAQADHLSPNALLRPVVQDYILPTLAYCGGPAEIAYFAQSEVLYRRLLGRMPVLPPRAGFSLLDATAAKLMQRFDLNFDAVLHGEEALRERVARALIPAHLEQRFTHVERAVDSEIDKLRGDLVSFDPTLAAALDKSRAKIRYQLEKNRKKAAREALRRDERASAAASSLAGLLYPNKHLQERFYSILPLLARHGFELLDRVYENVHLDCPDHVVLMV